MRNHHCEYWPTARVHRSSFLASTTSVDANALPCSVESTNHSVRYKIAASQDLVLICDIAVGQGQWRMKFESSGAGQRPFESIDIVLPLDPTTCATSIISGNWSKEQRFLLPAILSAPDLGQYYVTAHGG